MPGGNQMDYNCMNNTNQSIKLVFVWRKSIYFLSASVISLVKTECVVSADFFSSFFVVLSPYFRLLLLLSGCGLLSSCCCFVCVFISTMPFRTLYIFLYFIFSEY